MSASSKTHPPKDWKVRVEDMIEAIERVDIYTSAIAPEDFIKDIRTQDAVLRNLEVLGEASKRVPIYITAKFDQIQWSRIATMRNVLVHEYHSVDPLIVLDTCRHDLPPMLPVLRKILEES